MIISANDFTIPAAQDVRTTDDSLIVDLSDGRTISVPLAWFPRLVHATRKERGQWRLIGRGTGIHWTLLDEDISVEGLLAGRSSGEGQTSLKKWLDARRIDRHKRTSGKKKKMRGTQTQ
ncbi:MAG: DUF2442 domain-containing protein [Planctomycetes bacterium]|nr:DUF2442 domain-containing protein [Planctomycetota bacterium]MBI3834844.1 DUF2442 domain-containing protein [Planctomycetota bacterium]